MAELRGRMQMRNAESTAIVILTWNQRDTTLRCLRSLANANYLLSRVVLWDNGSTDGTDSAVRRHYPEVIYHRSTSNLGVASGRNAAASLAVRALSASHLMFLDNDMVVTSGFLEALWEPFTRDPNVAQTLAKIRLFKEPARLHSAGGQIVNFALGTKRSIGAGDIDRGQFDREHPCIPCGGATLVSAAVFLELNGFDPVFDPYGPEDFDFSYRVKKSGYRALYVPSAVLYHDYNPKDAACVLNAYDFSTMVERWLLLLERHASIAEKLVFCLFSAPAKLIRSALREARRGNLVALAGVPRGLVHYSFLLRNRKRAVRRSWNTRIRQD